MVDAADGHHHTSSRPRRFAVEEVVDAAQSRQQTSVPSLRYAAAPYNRRPGGMWRHSPVASQKCGKWPRSGASSSRSSSNAVWRHFLASSATARPPRHRRSWSLGRASGHSSGVDLSSCWPAAPRGERAKGPSQADPQRAQRHVREGRQGGWRTGSYSWRPAPMISGRSSD